MSKYEPLWEWFKENRKDNFWLTFAEIEKLLGFPIDHSFLTCKKSSRSTALPSVRSP